MCQRPDNSNERKLYFWVEARKKYWDCCLYCYQCKNDTATVKGIRERIFLYSTMSEIV